MTHPITPPPELVQKWLGEHFGCEVTGEVSVPELHLATRAAKWGADRELEACCSVLELSDKNAREFLYSARRPKPPSLAEEALAALQHAEEGWRPVPADCNTIRHALERLQQLEEQQ